MIIFDLDNCISDDLWRREFIDWSTTDLAQRYDRYHSLCYLDEIGNEELIERHRHQGIIILTARSRKYEMETVSWLTKHNIHYEYLLMRNDNEHNGSANLKLAQLRSLEALGVHFGAIDIAYDDRRDVIRMYRSLNINGQLAAIHDQEDKDP